MPIEYISEPFTVVIQDRNAILTWPDGSMRSIPLRVFRIESMRAAKAIAEYDAHKASIHSIKKRD